MARLKVLRRKITASLRSLWQQTLNDHIIAVAWSPVRGDQVAAAAVSGPIAIGDRKTGALLHTLPGHAFGTMALAWHPDGAVLASAGQDGKVRLSQVATGEPTHTLPGGAPWVEQVTWCPAPDGKRPPLLASAAGKVLRFWDANGALVQEHNDHSSTIADIQWHRKRNELAVAPYGGVMLRNPDHPTDARHFRWKGASLKLAWSPDGKYVASGDQDSTVHFWYANSGQDLQMWGYPTKVRELAWDPTSRYLATGGGPAVIVWDCSGKGPEGTKPLTLEAHRDYLTALAFQHKGSLLASAGQDGQVYLWAPGQEKTPLTRVSYPAPVTQIAWSPDDRHLLVGTDNGVIEVLALST
jgi:WD40 repeat protein